MARQLVKTDVDYAAVGEAGKIQNYEGEALAAIGSIIGEAISNIKPSQDKVDEQEKEVNSIEIPNLPPFEGFDLGEFEYDFSNPTTETEEIDEKIGQPLKNTGGGKIPPWKTAFEGFSKEVKGNWAKKTYVPKGTGFDQYEHYMKNLLPEEENKAKETVRSWANSKPKDFVYDPQNVAHVNEFKASKFYNKSLPYNFKPSGINRLKDSPLERRRSIMPGNRGLAGMSNEKQFNAMAGAGARVSQLPSEASGRSFVEKSRYLRTPSWASGTSVAAAIEGWNIGAEARNYRAQVAADAKDFQDREWKGMQAEAKQNSLIPRSFIASSKALQQKYTAAQSLPEDEKQDMLLKINSQLDDLERSKTMFSQGLATAKELYPNVNWNAVPPSRHDEALTFIKGGGVNAFFPNENGIMAFQGTTRNGRAFSYDLDTLFDPEKGLFANLPMKVDIYGEMDSIADTIEKNDYSATTIDADGVIREKPVSLDDLKNRIDYDLEKVIKQKGLKSLAFSLPMYNNEKGLDAFNLGMRLDQSHPDHPLNVVKENMTRGIHHKLTGYMSQVTEEESAGLKSQYRMQETAFKTEADIREALATEGVKQNAKKGRNTQNALSTDYLGPASVYADAILNKGDIAQLTDVLSSVVGGVKYDPETKKLQIVPEGAKKTVSKTKDAQGNEKTTESTTQSMAKTFDLNRDLGDLSTLIAGILHSYNAPVDLDRGATDSEATVNGTLADKYRNTEVYKNMPQN